jgi:hypothetical protein
MYLCANHSVLNINIFFTPSNHHLHIFDLKTISNSLLTMQPTTLVPVLLVSVVLARHLTLYEHSSYNGVQNVENRPDDGTCCMRILFSVDRRSVIDKH